MATPNVSGFPTEFPSELFRSMIKGAMQMGAPPDPAKRPVFVKRSAGLEYYRGEELLWRPGDPVASKPRTDRDGRPFDPTIRVREVQPERVTDADVAVETEDVSVDLVPVGNNFRPTRATVTALDVDYAKIAGAREMHYNGDRYLFSHEPENNGLFDVGVHTLIFFALEET